MMTCARGAWPSDVAIDGWQEASLVVRYKVRFKLFTLDNTLVTRKLGALQGRDRDIVREPPERVLAASA